MATFETVHRAPGVSEERVTSFEQRKTGFGERLRELRGELNAKALAVQVGWIAPKLSKIENGKQLPSEAELELLLQVLDVHGETAEELRTERHDLQEQRVVWRQKVRAGYKARQEESVDLEAEATLIRGIDFGVVPGLLQTPDYARHVLMASRALHGGNDDITEAVRTRMRRQNVLYEPDKTLELLMAESTLWHPIAPPEVMAAQIHRLMATIGTPNVRFGILPVRTRLPVLPLHGFWILDHVVLVEDLSGERLITDPVEVETYSTAADRLWKAAAEGDNARMILHQLIQQ